MAVKKQQGRKFEVELEYNYVTKETLARWGAGFVAAAVVLVGVLYWLAHRGNPDAKRAPKEIAKAETLETSARLGPNGDRFPDEMGAARTRLEDARSKLAEGRFPAAIEDAIKAQGAFRRIIEGTAPTVGDATILDFSGKVEVQRRNNTSWETARSGMKLFEGDFVKTGPNGAVELVGTSDGTLYRIKPETLFEFHSSGRETGKRVQVNIVIGEVNLQTGESNRSVVTTDKATADVGQGSNVAIGSDKERNTRGDVLKGSAVISINRTGEKISLNERDSITVGTAGAGPRVRLPDAPGLLLPDDNSSFDLRKVEPLLKWSPVRDAVRYKLQIARNRFFIPDSLVLNLSDRTRSDATVQVTEEGTYFWRVATINRANVTSEWSPYRKFRMETPMVASTGGRLKKPPTLSVATPSVFDNIVTIAGKTDAGASITVNGEAVTLDPSGEFKKVISLATEGASVIEVKAVDAFGNEAIKKVQVFVQPQ